MGFYDTFILPKLVHWACQQNPSMYQREKVVPQAHGKVLEIGVGSGLNLSFYNPKSVQHLTAIDPSKAMWEHRKIDTKSLDFDMEFMQASAEFLPMESSSFDSVVMTYTLCSIKESNLALNEIRRVLKPKGNLFFCEHGKAPDVLVQKWQNRLNPIWKRIGGGCNLNKDIPKLISENGLKLESMETMYIPGWKPASFNYWGMATPI